MTRSIDVMHLGRDRVIGAYELGEGIVVDPGPASSVDTLLEHVEPRVLLLTHIHLDHAGATGVLVRRNPDLKVYVHERGAPHLIDPGKLLKSAGQLYGDDMDRLWGEVAPVPEENIVRLDGGETIEDGIRVEYAPGHASHHVVYLDEGSGDAFVGDVGGVRVPPYEFTLAPTPPPDIDVERWNASLDLLEEWGPQRLCLTHFGAVDEPGAQIERVRAWLADWGPKARDLDKDDFCRAVAERMHAAGDEIGERLEQAAPPDQMWLGLDRYWRKRAEREAEGAAA